MFPYVGEVTAQVGEALAALAASELFDDAQRATLAALCDTWVPSLDPPDGDGDPTGFWARSASDYCGADGGRAGPAAIGGAGRAARRAARAARRRSRTRAWPPRPRRSPRGDRRGFMAGPRGARRARRAPRRLPDRCIYALPDLGTGINPNWPAIGYPGPQALPKPAAEVERPIAPIVPDEPHLVLEADVVVVGSGAGGGVIAAELAAAGKQVCVLEMGGYHDESEFNGLELWAYQHLFLNGGPFATAEGQVSIQAGSSFGGGTVAQLDELPADDRSRPRRVGRARPRGHRRARLRRRTWTPSGSGSASTPSAATSTARTGCSRRAARRSASTSATITRNTDPATYDPVTAGYMGFGDQSGSKRSTAKTYLADAAARGADFLVHCRVERILVEDGRAAGVEAIYLDPDGRTAAVTVKAPTVVVACGSIESPALLLRSRHRRPRGR